MLLFETVDMHNLQFTMTHTETGMCNLRFTVLPKNSPKLCDQRAARQDAHSLPLSRFS